MTEQEKKPNGHHGDTADAADTATKANAEAATVEVPTEQPPEDVAPQPRPYVSADPLAEENELLQAELAETKDKLLRAMAETENTRRRLERDKADAIKFAGQRLAKDLLSVADNLRRALESVPDEIRDAATDFVAGVEMTERELHQVFEKHNIVRVDPLGERFDPKLHEAMVEVPGTGQPAGTIVQVVQPGYALADRLLRPAMVAVAKGDGASAGEA